MVITIVVLSICLIISIYVNINLTKKFEKLDDMAQDSVDALLENEKFLTELRNRIRSQQSYLRQLDRIGSFEADDETGYFFKEMKDIMNEIAVYFGENPIDDEKKSILENKKPADASFQKDYYL
jgi:competence protein ComGC